MCFSFILCPSFLFVSNRYSTPSVEYHKFARDLSSLTGLPLISETKSTETFYTNSDPLPVPGMDPDDHEFYRLSDVRLTVANITHADLGLYTCRVRTSAGVGEGYTRLEAHRKHISVNENIAILFMYQFIGYYYCVRCTIAKFVESSF